MAVKPRLGDILVKTGVVNDEQLARALKMQSQTGCLLGEAVIRLGLATEEAIAMAISKQIGVPYASRENKVLRVEKGQGLERIVPERFARDNAVLPLFLDEKALAVAMHDPDNMMVVDNLKMMTNCEIQPFIATRAQILRTIDEFYTGGSSNLIERMMETNGQEGAVASEESEVEVDTSDSKLDLDKVMVEAKGVHVVSFVNAVLKQAVAERASDIHLEIFDERVTLRFRIDGVLYERTPPPRELFGAIVSRVKILSRLDIAERRLPQDGAIAMKLQNRNIDLRVSICPTVYGEKVVMRVLDKGQASLDIEKLGLEARQKSDFLAAAKRPHGLIFLTGPTGSGKTTTLYTILSAIKSSAINIMTIEDPVEYKLDGINQVQVRTNIELTFASALRSFLRQDPDVILVGEVRDQETAQTCLRAALTGHLVLSTLHTNTALDAVPRLMDLGIEPFMLSSSLCLTAAQRLVRVLCASCKRPYKPDAAQLEAVVKESMLPDPPSPADVVFYREQGCEKCSRTGFLGRRAIYEVVLVTRELSEVIYKSGGDLAKLREASSRQGMWSLRASGWRKVLAGQTTVEEVLAVAVAD